ncbi:hypothetical protein BDQ17DRAFT_30792 [Cyathus striatus]|nr:hypothetical protein BDQ17DRAFT_30792 [Cyathus striatus]
MPKSAKKRKDKAADFSKAKLKLGKGKQVPSNAVDTSFKSRFITLPTQSIASEKDGSTPVTKRRLTFDDLILKLKHYSPGVRRDALLGLQELLTDHLDMLESCLTVLLTGVIRMLNDEDSSVRKGLLSFLSWLFPRIPSEDISAHAPMLLLFATSAQTHIFPEIRIDAIRFINLLLASIPDIVVQGWNEPRNSHGSRVLDGYLGLLNAGTKYGEHEGPLRATSTASVVLSPPSKLVVLQSLSSFLQAAIRADPTMSRTAQIADSRNLNPWFMKSSFTSSAAYSHFHGLLECSSAGSRAATQHIWLEEVEKDSDMDRFWYRYPFINSEDHVLHFEDLENISTSSNLNETDEANSSKFHFISHLARTLHSTLVGTFLDYAPTVFGPSSKSSETEAQLILSVSQVAHSLYGMMSQIPQNNPDSYVESLHAMVSYMAPYFPFRSDGNRDTKIEPVLQNLNLIYCELHSLMLIRENEQNRKMRQGANRPRPLAYTPKAQVTLHKTAVSMYITKLLLGEGTSQVAQPISFITYTELLPTIWAFINNPTTAEYGQGSDVLKAMLDHALRAPVRSNVKMITVEFVGRLILLDTDAQYKGNFRLGQDSTVDKMMEAWLLHLPQILWEIGAANLPFAEVILRTLLRSIQARCIIAGPEVLTGLRSRLEPYFKITHPTRGELLGPFSKLPPKSNLRRLALDVVATLSTGSDKSSKMDGLIVAVNTALSGTAEYSYWLALKKVSVCSLTRN